MMRKKLREGIGILLAVSMTFTAWGGQGSLCAVTYAAEEKSDSIEAVEKLTYSVSGTRATITGCDEGTTEIVIPASIGDYTVSGIADGAFKENQSITSVVICEGVTTIGYQAFYGCISLSEVQIPSTLTNWTENECNNSAFEGCTAISELTLAEGLTVLGQRAFAGCTSLERVSVPSTITKFWNCVFEGCSNLKEVTLAEGIKQIGYGAFKDCISLKEIHIPSTVTEWPSIHVDGIKAPPKENGAFTGCISLEKLTFAEGLTTLMNFNGVKGCTSLKEVELPTSMQSISYAFNGCDTLERVILKPGLETIGEQAFSGCTSLLEIEIPNTVTSVEYSAFSNCTSLENLVFPASLTQFGQFVTSGCRSLKGIYLLAESVEGYQPFGRGQDTKIYCLPGSQTYTIYQEGLQENAESVLAECPQVEGVRAEGCAIVYDGEEHPTVALTGTREDDEILFRLEGENYQSEMPQIRELGTYPVGVCVLRKGEENEPFLAVFCFKVQAQVKKEAKIQLKDREVEENQEYVMEPELFESDGEIVYTYYEDEELTKVHTGNPTVPGIYYVQGTVQETESYFAAKSNVAKFIIRSSMPTETPDGAPGNTQKPGITPSIIPDDTPGVTPSTTPVINPQETQIPITSPSIEPSKEPGTDKVTVKKVTLKKVKSTSKKTVEVQWKKCAGVTGYEIWLGRNKKFSKGKKTCLVKSGKTVKKEIKKLKGKTTYYVKIRAYRVVNGKRHYGAFSRVKSVRVKG